MIRNYLTITFRNFLRDRSYTLINVLGLSIGVTACIIIFLLIDYDLQFDKLHSHYDQVYRVVQRDDSPSGGPGAAVPYPLPKAFRNDFPEVPLVTQVHSQSEAFIRVDDDKFKVENVLFADSLFFEVFDFGVVSGNPRVELGQPGKAFLTQSLADKILKGREHATLKIDNRVAVEVVGIIADPPPSSHITYNMIVSMESFDGDFIGGFALDHWGMTAAGFTYIVLPDNISPESVNERLKPFVRKYLSPEDAQRKSYVLQPLRDIHFGNEFTENPGSVPNASYTQLWVMGVLGLFILVIACINFVNLATALAIRKSKEIGIRKTLGAARPQLAAYFLGETLMLTAVAVLISLCIVEWTIPWLNGFLEKNLDMRLFSNPTLWLFLLALTTLVTVLSGFYPALILSGYNPSVVLKNKITTQRSGSAGVRKVLVVCQFMIAQVLIMGTLIISNQMQYVSNTSLGFDKEAVVNIPIPDNDPDKIASLRARLEPNADIRHVSISIGAPTSSNSFGTGFFLSDRGPEDRYSVSVKSVDRHYLETYGLKMKAGRWFNEADEKSADVGLPDSLRRYGYIINEVASEKLGFSPEEALGKRITTGIYSINAEIVGVVENFHVASLHDEIKPVVMLVVPQFYYDAGVKLNMHNIRATLAFIETQWKEVYPDYYFEYNFLDEELAEQYRQDDRTFTLFKVFAGVSIFIACLGLYGLISFMANQKLKEVGIRKVLGASMASIVLLFSKEFIKLIVIAFVIAAPLAWYFMTQWLDNFAYKTTISPLVFVIALVCTLLISLLTVSYRSVRAAMTNPAETLRTE